MTPATLDDAPPAFAGSGRGVRIAVIDSGVFPGHPHIGRIAGGAALWPGGEISTEPSAWLDRIGHGTAVMAAIQEKAPDADCYAVKVFHKALRTTGVALVEAIDWCVAEGMDVINLSLGSPNPAHIAAFSEAAARAAEAGTLLLAAREAGELPCYPGSLPGVLGVGVAWDCPRHSFRPALHGFDASGYPRPVPGVAPSRNLSGVSFAVANMSGLAALAIEHLAGPRRNRLSHVTAALRLRADEDRQRF